MMDSCHNYESSSWLLPSPSLSSNCIMSPTGSEFISTIDKMNSLQRKAQVKLNTMP